MTEKVDAFAKAVKSHDLEAAKAGYETARYDYEYKRNGSRMAMIVQPSDFSDCSNS